MIMEITPTLSIPDNELTFTFVRSSGPGGQNVNKVATAAQLRFDVRNSPSLSVEVKERLAKLAGIRMTQDGILIIEARRYRTQEQNRADALLRLIGLDPKSCTSSKNQACHPTQSGSTNQTSGNQEKARRCQKTETVVWTE